MNIDEIINEIKDFSPSKRRRKWKSWYNSQEKEMKEEGLSESEIQSKLKEYRREYDLISESGSMGVIEDMMDAFQGELNIYEGGIFFPVNELHKKHLPKRNLQLKYDTGDSTAKQIFKGVKKVATGILEDNLETMLEHIEEKELTRELGTISTKTFSIESYLGGLDIKDIYVRDELYNYWAKIKNRYPKLVEAHKNLKTKAKPILEKMIEELGEESGNLVKLKSELTKLEEWDEPPKWILEIDKVDKEEMSIFGRFYNYVLDLEILHNIGKDIEREKDEGNEEKYGDLASAMWAEVNDKPTQQGEFGDTMLDPKLSSSTEDDEHIDFITEKVSLDPLLALYMKRNKSKLVAITERGYDELENKIEDWLENSKIPTITGGDEDEIIMHNILVHNRVIKDIENIRDTISIDVGRGGTEYWLPYTIALDIDVSEKETPIDADKNKNDVEFYLRKVADFISDEEIQFPSVPVFGRGSTLGNLKITDLTGKERLKYQRLVEQQETLTGRISGTGDPSTITDLAEEVKEHVKYFLEALNDYYFAPVYSGKIAGRVPNFIVSYPAKKIMAVAQNFKVHVLKGNVYQQMLQTDVNVGHRELDDIYNFLKEVTSRGTTAIDEDLQDLALAAISGLNKMFQGWKKRNLRHVGAIIYHIINEEDPDSELKKLIKLRGKSVEDLSKEFHANAGDEYPLFALPFYLEDNFGLYQAKEMDSKTKESSKKLRNLLANIDDMPVLLKQLLKAHDAIRKAMGKETNFAMRPMTVDNYEEVIEKIYLNHNVDLAHLEIENIVKEVDSFSNIAKCYGITEEIVYQVKSEFR